MKGRLALGAIRLGGSAFALCACTTWAYAQDIPAGTSAQPEATPSPGVEDIIVTAQRRSENLQSVPISISAFTADSLKERNVANTTDLMKVTPGLQAGSGSIQRNELYIRGIGSNRFDAGGEASSAIFIDDVYQPRFSSLLTDLLDVERVEVLKGPQGTLYGRNTIGGAIAIYTPVPSDHLEVTARADAGSKNLIGGQMSLNGPLADGVALGVSFGYRQRDGFMVDSTRNQDDGTQVYGGRVKLALTPTDRLKILLTGGLFETHQDAIVFDRANSAVFFSPKTSPTDGDRYIEALNRRTGATTTLKQLSGRIDYDLDDLTLTSITAFQRSKDTSVDDQDSSVLDSFSYDIDIISKAVSQEFRLSSERGGGLSAGGRLNWVAGLYYFHEDAFEITNFRLGVDALPFPAPRLNSTGKDGTVNSYAAFGQATYAVTHQLNLTVGARYTRDKKDFDVTGVTTAPGLPLLPASFAVNATKAWNKFTPKVAIDFTPISGVLLYGSWAKGYKSGATQTAVFDPINAVKLVQPETVDTYEIGIKSDFLDRRVRLNIAGYYSKYKDLQVRRIVVVPIIENAANSTIKGIEVNGVIVPVQGLRFDVGYNYLDARYDTYIPDALNDYSGNRLPRSPKHVVTLAARYEIPLADGSKIAAGAQTFWSSKFYFQPNNNPVHSQGAYSTSDVNLSYTTPGGHYELSLWGRNIFDKEYLTYSEDLAPAIRRSWSDRATYGATLRYKL